MLKATIGQLIFLVCYEYLIIYSYFHLANWRSLNVSEIPHFRYTAAPLGERGSCPVHDSIYTIPNGGNHLQQHRYPGQWINHVQN